MTEGGGITYSFEKLFARLEAKIDALQHTLDASLVDIRGQLSQLATRVMQTESKVHEIDQYGSREMRDIRDRVVLIEAGDLTKKQVEAALAEREDQGRTKGGYRLQIVGALVGAVGLLLAIVIAIQTLMGGH